MAAKVAVVLTGSAEAAPAHRSTTTLSLLTGRVPRQDLPDTAEVVVFDQAQAHLPKPYCTSDADAAEAMRDATQRREWESRQQARVILMARRAGDPGADGGAMLVRPHREVPIAFLADETLEAALTRQFADSHLIDKLWDNGQLNDWEYAAANRLLELADDAGLLSSKVALIGRTGAGIAEMSDGMARARGLWNRLLREIGFPGDDLLTSLCQGELTLRGSASRREALRDGLRHLARHWRIEIA